MEKIGEAAVRAFTLALVVFWLIGFGHAANAQDRTFGDFECTDDCSGHAAGYKWAEEHSIEDEDRCPEGNSQSFHEGCIVYTRDPSRGAEDDDEGHAVGVPIDEPDTDNDDR